MKIASVRNTSIFAIVAYFVVLVFDKSHGILITNNVVGSISYTFGYVFGLPLIVSIPLGILSKIRKKNFVDTFCSTFFFMLFTNSLNK